jgi:spermidine synthase
MSSASTSSRLVRPAVVLLFMLSGASGLIFETLWMRMLTTTFGATTFALSTVLTVFMGGLALGSFLSGRLADRLRNPASALLVYGGLELVVGGYGLLFPSILDQLHVLHAHIWAQWQPSQYTFALIRFFIVSVVLILPTTAMGATLPILSRFYARREALGREAGTLYAVNIFGAVAGTFFAGFVLMPWIGLSATNRVACAINLALCVASLGLFWQVRGASTEPTSGAGADGVEEPPWGTRVWLALLAVAVSGLVSMVYQQAWTRVLSLIVGSSVYAFALILIAFLLGLALGGAVYARRTAGREGQVGNLAAIHIVVATTVLVGYAFMDQLPTIFVALTRSTDITPARIFALKFLVCALVVLLPTFFMGMVFPATISLCARSMTGVGRTVGRVYSVNTVGAIAGSFLGGFVLIPVMGVQRTIGTMIVLNLLIAAAFTVAARIPRRARMLRGAAIGAILLVTVAGATKRWRPARMTAGVFRLALFDASRTRTRCPDPQDPISRLFHQGVGRKHLRAAQRTLGFRPDLETPCDAVVGKRLISYREGVVATVSTWQIVLRGFDPSTCWEVLSLQVNGKSDASSAAAFRRPDKGRCADFLGRPERIKPAYVSPRSDMETQVLSGLLGQMLHRGARPPNRALVIGWGSGVTVGSMAVTGMEHIDAVELEPEVLRAARVFSRYNHRASRHQAVKVIEADGRNFLIAARKPYDIIVSEPSNPWMTGAASLFTQEFFRLVRKRLHPDGVFIQWLQLYEISRKNVASIIATLQSVFPSVTVFQPRYAKVDLLLVATKRPLKLDARRMKRLLDQPKMRAELGRIQIRTVGDLLARHLVDDRHMRVATRAAEHNTDDNARVEFSAPKDLINYRKHTPARILSWLVKGVAPVVSQVHTPPPDLSAQLVDAYLRLGDLAAAEAVLKTFPAADARARQRRLMVKGLRKLPPTRVSPDAKSRRREVLRVALAGPVGARTHARLGLALADSRHQGLALLFLMAAEKRSTLSGGQRWILARLLRKLSLHRLAYEQALAAAQ